VYVVVFYMLQRIAMTLTSMHTTDTRLAVAATGRRLAFREQSSETLIRIRPKFIVDSSPPALLHKGNIDDDVTRMKGGH
jgi:hypothetical protein